MSHRINSIFKKRILCFVIAFVVTLSFCVPQMLISAYGANEDAGVASVDKVGPSLKSISLNTNKANTGDTVRVTAVVTDDVSGTASVRVTISGITSVTLSNSSGNTWTGTFTVDSYLSSGTYGSSSEVVCTDKADNITRYTKNLTIEITKTSSDTTPVVENESDDNTAPDVKSLLVSPKVLKEGQNVTVTAKVVDTESEVSHVSVYFKGKDTGNVIHISLSKKSGSTDMWEGKVLYTSLSSRYYPNERYEVTYAYVGDSAKNYKYDYLTSISSEEKSNAYFDFENSGVVDTEAPVLKDIYLDDNLRYVYVPGYVGVTADIDDGDGAGVASATVTFYNTNAKREADRVLSTTLYPYYTDINGNKVTDGKYHGMIKLSPYVLGGIYKGISIYARDRAGYMLSLNEYTYKWTENGEGVQIGEITGYGNLPEELRGIKFETINTAELADLVTSTGSPTLNEEIDAQAEGAKIIVDSTVNNTLSGDTLSTIQGLDKTVTLRTEGYEWQFNGQDINREIKDVDLSIDIQPISAYADSATGDGISALVEDTPTVVLSFSDANGVLPGKAKIRIKADYALKQYLGTNGICVYYYDSTNGKLERVSENLRVTNDSFIEFSIEHCCYYILTKGKITGENVTAYKPVDTTTTNTNDESSAEEPGLGDKETENDDSGATDDAEVKTTDNVEVKTTDDAEVKTTDNVEVKTTDDTEVKTTDDAEVKTSDDADVHDDRILPDNDELVPDTPDPDNNDNTKPVSTENENPYYRPAPELETDPEPEVVSPTYKDVISDIVPAAPELNVTSNRNETYFISLDLSNGDKVTDNNGVTYTVSDAAGNTLTFSGGTVNSDGVAVVPDSVNISGKKWKVTRVGSNAFKGKKVKKAIIGKNVTQISKNAFKGSKSIKTIVIRSKKIKKITKGAFNGIGKNTIIKVPASKLKAYRKLVLKAGGRAQNVKAI